MHCYVSPAVRPLRHPSSFHGDKVRRGIYVGAGSRTHARAMTAGGPAWPAAWKLDSGQQMLFWDLVTVGRFANGWHFVGKCFCGLDFARHDKVLHDKSPAGTCAFVCERCKCFFITDPGGHDGSSLRVIDYDTFRKVYITIEDKTFTQFEYLVLQKTLALKMALDKHDAAPSASSAKQHAFTGTVVSKSVEQLIITEQKWITTDNDLTVLLAHFETFTRAMTSKSREAFTIPGKTEHIELTYLYCGAIGKNHVNVYSPGSIGLSKVYLVSLKKISIYNFTYNIADALKKIGLVIGIITMMAAIRFAPAEIEEIEYFDAYENKTTSLNITNSLTITSEAFTAVLYAVFNMRLPDSVMLLLDHTRGDRQEPQTLMPFNNEGIGSCLDTVFAGIGTLNNVSVTVSGTTNVTKTYANTSIVEMIADIKTNYSVATLVPGGGASPYLQIESPTRKPWTGANMYRTNDSSALKASIAGRVTNDVRQSWDKGDAVLKKDGDAYIVYRAGEEGELNLFEPSAQVYVQPVFDKIAADICINAPNVVSWDKLKSGMKIVTDHKFWAEFEANLFTPVPFWKQWAATVGPNEPLKLTNDDVLPADMVYVPAWLALDILLKTEGLKFVPDKNHKPGATYSVYDIWSLIATPKSSGTIMDALARVATRLLDAVSSKAVQAASVTVDIGNFAIARAGEGFTLFYDDVASVRAQIESAKDASADASVTDLLKMVTGAAVANFVAVPAAVATAAAYRYSGSSTFNWTTGNATKPIEIEKHGGTFTIKPELYKRANVVDSGMHYVLSSFMEHIRLLTGQTLNNEIALPRSILTANNKGFQGVILNMLANHEISQVGGGTLSFSRTLTGAGLTNIYSHSEFTESTLYQEISPGNYINIGSYDRENSTLTVSNGDVTEVQYDASKMTAFETTKIELETATAGDLYPVEPGTISINETGLPPFTLPRVNATKIFATANNFNFSTINDTISAANSTIDKHTEIGTQHPATNTVNTLADVLRLSELYSDVYTALAYMPDRTIFENNTLAAMAYATCIQNAKTAWKLFFQNYTAGLVHTIARLQCNVWSNVNMQMLHLENDTSSQIWPALQYVVDHLVDNKADFGITTDGALIDLSTIIYWLDSATPPGPRFGENATIWFQFGKKMTSLSLNGLSNVVRWTPAQPDNVAVQISALNIYYNARRNGITESVRQNMNVWGINLSFPNNRTLYPSPQLITPTVIHTLVSPSPTVATLQSVRLYQAFPWISSSVICCFFYMFWARVRPGGPKGEVVIAGKTEFKEMLPRGIQPMILRHAHAVDSPLPAGWAHPKSSDDAPIQTRIQFTQKAP